MAYVLFMRAFVFTLAILCAILSGWTSAVAQIQGIGSMPEQHEGHGGDGQRHSDTSGCQSGCPHPAKGMHPMLCAACFAVEVLADDLGRLPVAASRVLPLADRPLIASPPQPVAPPPKTLLSI